MDAVGDCSRGREGVRREIETVVSLYLVPWRNLYTHLSKSVSAVQIGT